MIRMSGPVPPAEFVYMGIYSGKDLFLPLPLESSTFLLDLNLNIINTNPQHLLSDPFTTCKVIQR